MDGLSRTEDVSGVFLDGSHISLKTNLLIKHNKYSKTIGPKLNVKKKILKFKTLNAENQYNLFKLNIKMSSMQC